MVVFANADSCLWRVELRGPSLAFWRKDPNGEWSLAGQTQAGGGNFFADFYVPIEVLNLVSSILLREETINQMAEDIWNTFRAGLKGSVVHVDALPEPQPGRPFYYISMDEKEEPSVPLAGYRRLLSFEVDDIPTGDVPDWLREKVRSAVMQNENSPN
jgi:hypothetical protein